VQDVWKSAGGRETIQNASLPLNSGNKIIVAPDRSFSLSRMSGRDLLTLGLAIDPNLATAEDLEAIPGFGPVLAKRIIEFREEHGPFQNIENLLDVKGMGPGKLATIRLYLEISRTQVETGNPED
jgi:competence protein ComEA